MRSWPNASRRHTFALFVLLGCLATPLSARCGLDRYTVEGIAENPIGGMTISVSFAQGQQSLVDFESQQGNLIWHGVDPATGAFKLDIMFDPTRKWRLPFWGEICNKRPDLLELILRKPGKGIFYQKRSIDRKDIEYLRSKSKEGRPWSFRIEIGEITHVEMVEVKPKRRRRKPG